MKRFFVLILAAFWLSPLLAQTISYGYVSAEDPSSGVKERHYGSFCLTFTGGGSTFYQSDAKGEETSSYSRDAEFGKEELNVDMVQYVMGYGPFGPMYGSSTVNTSCDGRFSYCGYENGMRKYRCRKFKYYYGQMMQRTQYGDDIWLYVWVSDDYSTVKVKDASRYSNSGKIFTARRKETSDSAPSHMW